MRLRCCLFLLVAVICGVSHGDEVAQPVEVLLEEAANNFEESQFGEDAEKTQESPSEEGSQPSNATVPALDVAETNSTKANVTYKVSCLLNNTDFPPVVEIVNSTKLLTLMQVQTNITSQQTPATCLVVLFYSPSCPFSCMAAPHFNALPRMFPNVKMAAVDTSTRYNFNAQYGIVGVPSLLLFHNGRPAARFNSSSDYSLEAFSKFITTNSGLKPEGKLYVTSVDFNGPISSVPEKQTDYCLILSWTFILICILYFFYYSSWCQWLVDAVRSAWREAEAQHHHVD